MMWDRSRTVVLADILFFFKESPKEQSVHCRCSRAFAIDRDLYRSDARLLKETRADIVEAEEEEEEDE
ncbi:unnamed protein product [Knipowitschia caucasica]